jgi:hypothetical protein
MKAEDIRLHQKVMYKGEVRIITSWSGPSSVNLEPTEVYWINGKKYFKCLVHGQSTNPNKAEIEYLTVIP